LACTLFPFPSVLVPIWVFSAGPIYHFSKFLKDDLSAKAHILEDFENMILPWWETDVINHVVDGKPRFFSVYLID
jgi:hypothetical protein